ncbi:MAG: hypothetical protein J1G06_09570 [Oscillospiraceae bacterium]|nr:hypothetical protein [Oscillospiraceae bacterium]
MKKFETPIMNISLFSVENIVTESNPTPETKLAVDAAKSSLETKGLSADAGTLFEFTF